MFFKCSFTYTCIALNLFFLTNPQDIVKIISINSIPASFDNMNIASLSFLDIVS